MTEMGNYGLFLGNKSGKILEHFIRIVTNLMAGSEENLGKLKAHWPENLYSFTKTIFLFYLLKS